MKKYYCHECAINLGLISGVKPEPLNLTGSSYLFQKFEKHTQIPTGSGIISIYSDPTYATYRDYTISGYFSGSLEIDDRNRKNLIWYAGKDVGVTYLDGKFQFPTDAVKVVLSENTASLHSFPVNSQNYSSASCSNCGRNILT